jgi:hypothetical protein
VPEPRAARAVVHVESGLMDVHGLRGVASPDTQPEHRAGDLLEIEGEVLAAHADLGLEHLAGA